MEQNTSIKGKKSVIMYKKRDEIHIFLHLDVKKSCQFTFNYYIAGLN